MLGDGANLCVSEYRVSPTEIKKEEEKSVSDCVWFSIYVLEGVAMLTS